MTKSAYRWNSGWIAPLLICLSLASLTPAQELKFEKYQLENGLTVILHEDHSLPQATINLWYKVGALNEPVGRSGFAHLFEHLMFMGTQRVPNSQFDQIMESKGGYNNASTSLSRTNYYSNGPATMLPTLLWLDADRLEDLGPSIDEKKLKLQVDVVRNEIRQNIENQPYMKANEASYRYMYPVGHPYHNAVYGTHEDLEAATVENVHDFFATFYTPGNCSLVVAGDLDPAQIKPMIAKLFGDLPRGNVSAPKSVPVVKLDRVQRATFLDKVPQPKIEFVYHSPGYYEPGDGELDLIAGILAAGPSSRLYKRLIIDEQIATDVSASQESTKGASLFRVSVTAKADADLGRIEREMDEEIAALQAKGPTEDELTQRKNVIEQGKLSALQSLGSRADKLNEYEFYLGTPDGLARDMDRYRSATVDGVRDVAAKVLTADARLIMQVLPESRESRSATARDKSPEDLSAKPFAPPMPSQFTLGNGVKVQLYPRPEVPLVSMMLLLTNGQPLESVEDAGLAWLTADMTRQGAAGKDAATFDREIELLGASLNASADIDSMRFSLDVLKRNLAPAVGLLADSALRPNLLEADFTRERAIILDGIEQELENPASVVWRVASRMYYQTLRRAIPANGTPQSVQALTLAKVKAAHAAVVRPDMATILIAGDITVDEARPMLENAFGAKAWPRGKTTETAASQQKLEPAKGLRLYVVDRPGATQTSILLMSPGVAYGDEARVPLSLANTVLGGSFTSRLNQNLREVHGFTYGAGSNLTSLRDLGTFAASASVRAEVTGDALKEMLSELNKIGSADLSDDEVTKSRETRRNDMIESYGTLSDVIDRAATQVVLGMSPDSAAKEFNAIESVRADQVRELSQKLVDLDRSLIVLVGDKAKVVPQLGGLKLPQPTELTALGEKK